MFSACGTDDSFQRRRSNDEEKTGAVCGGRLNRETWHRQRSKKMKWNKEQHRQYNNKIERNGNRKIKCFLKWTLCVCVLFGRFAPWAHSGRRIHNSRPSTTTKKNCERVLIGFALVHGMASAIKMLNSVYVCRLHSAHSARSLTIFRI